MLNHSPCRTYSPKTVQRFWSFLLAAILFLPVYSPCAASDVPFNKAANWGGTGLFEIPNARVLEDGELRIGYAYADPFQWIVLGMGVFPGLEVTGRYTEITNIESGLGEAFGANKDKAVDLKYQILKETRGHPAIAIGLQDFIGTRLFPAEYLVVSRQIFPFDFTLGIGTKRLSGNLEFLGIDDVGIFGGIEWAFHKRANLILEYNPIEYENDEPEGRGVPEGASSPINLGIKAEVLRGINLGVSWQRGDTLGVMANLSVKLGESLIPKAPNPPKWRTTAPPPFTEHDGKARMQKIQREIMKAGFREVSVYTNGAILTAEFENQRYIHNQKAAGRVLRILLAYAPDDINMLSAVLTRWRIPVLKVSVRPGHLDQFLMGKMRQDIFEQLVTVETVRSKDLGSLREMAFTDKSGKPDWNWGIKPEFQTFLNDPSGVFKFRVGIKPYANATIAKGSQLFGSYMIPFYSDITSSNIPPPDAVRSDLFLYLGNEPTLDRLEFDQVFRLNKKTFGSFSTGYFDLMYAGVAGETLTFLGNGSVAVGASGDWVRKRVPGTNFELFDDQEYYTALGNLYTYIRPLDFTLLTQYGRFLGGDVGLRFEASRTYENGTVIGAWYSFTDTDNFLTAENRGYNDKGVFVRIPANMFSPRESRTTYRYSFQPWTRDVAQTVWHRTNLYTFGSDLMPFRFKGDWDRLRK